MGRCHPALAALCYESMLDGGAPQKTCHLSCILIPDCGNGVFFCEGRDADGQSLPTSDMNFVSKEGLSDSILSTCRQIDRELGA